ncbi:MULTISPECIES: transposase [unclassified Colwellia]|uniref:transposase n=1 Tax=unclassified Colwellia TaxID=196834 RepID=UPI0015F778E3|nr:MULTISPECIES: transposase [unclassified Colwellia]MBA6257287.1 transposase [Colwellia sp. MB3u-28]MBA6258871.1 transposase [Colwellia sp. MB3u-41]
MARRLRVSPIGVAQHVIQRGNNRQVCFASQQDFSAYLGWLEEYAKKYHVEIHAWVLMTNHVHLLCTPRCDGGVSKLMQSLGRQYVRYFNFSYKRTGSLWEGRYKSCLVQEDKYLIQLYRYIELNPVRAGMVADPSSYLWSSYQVNALGKPSVLCTPHALLIALGGDLIARQAAYRALFKFHVEGKLLTDIREALNQGMAIGNDAFKAQLATLTGRRMTPKKFGRPVGWRKNRD